MTVPDSSRSWMTNLSYGSRLRSSSSASVCSSATATTDASRRTQKPHKANHAAWEAMRLLRHHEVEVGLDDFRLLRRLGSGDIGNVYMCQIRNPAVGSPPCLYAMKVVDREALGMRNKLQRAEMEKEIPGMIDHPFLPTLYAEFQASHYSCFFMDFCPGGDLYAAHLHHPARRFNISSVKVSAHDGIVYRDLKPENVLVREDGHVMLSDFDLCLKCDVVPRLLRTKTRPKTTSSPTQPSCASSPMQPVLSCFSPSSNRNKTTREKAVTEAGAADAVVAEPINARSKSLVGTHEYLAPEVISGQGHGSAVDWWTFGVFLYELLYGITPFKGETNHKTLVNVLKRPLGFPTTSFSGSRKKEMEEVEEVQDLIRKLSVKNPKKRIGSLMGSVEIKRHEFFTGVNWPLIRSVRPPPLPKDLVSRVRVLAPKVLSKRDRDEPYHQNHFDYF